VDVYLETGKQKTFAAAADWPGWARAGRDAAAALATLLDYGPRYRATLGLPDGGPDLPQSAAQLTIVERLTGNATTDFGAPGLIPALDARPTAGAELDRLVDLLRRCWAAFDRAAETADGRALAPAGPRGGGRSLAKMRAHVAEAQAAYLAALAGGGHSSHDEPAAIQAAFVDALAARARGELPDFGPRGGRRWPARYAVRRSAWHALDHAWEIEDRLA
jgi:hypothetical protein